MATCRRCGEQVRDDVKFCPSCGAPMGAPRPAAPRTDRPYSDRPRAERPYPDRPRAERPYSDRPRTERPYSDRGYSDRGYSDGQYPDRPRSGRPPQRDFSERVSNFNNTADTTERFDARDAQSNKVMAILAYLGFLVFIPMFGAKESRFARYHANQGLVLFIAEIAYTILSTILSNILLAISWRLFFISTIFSVIGIVFGVLAIIGIINAANGRAKELPIVGKFRILK